MGLSQVLFFCGSPSLQYMLYSLSSNTYVRFYGPYAYFYNNLSKSELLLKNVNLFRQLFSRKPVDVDVLQKKIISGFENLQRQNIINDFNYIFNLLVGNGFIVTKEKVNAKHFSYENIVPASVTDQSPLPEEETSSPSDILQEYFFKHPTLFTLSVDLTRACTERCIHCYIPEYKSSFIDTKKLFQVIDEFSVSGGLKIKFTGGECMLHPDFSNILHYASRKDLIITVLSNLTICNSVIMKSLYEANVGVVQTSLYGMSPETHDKITQLPGSFNRTMNWIQTFIKHGIPLQISCPLMHANFREYQKVLEFGKSIGVRVDSDYVLTAKTNHDCSNLLNRLTLEELEDYLRKYCVSEISLAAETGMEGIDYDGPVCEVGTNQLCLSSEGQYYPCNGSYEYVVGSYDTPISQVWNHSPQLNLLRNLKWKDLKKCPHCPKALYCKICPLKNFNEQNDLTRPIERNCQIADIKDKIFQEIKKGGT